ASAGWSRRRLLQSAPAAMALAILPRNLRAGDAAKAPAPTFSRFVDIAPSAAATQPIVYGVLDSATFILEITGCGCAFIDYDNDGWMDVFMLTGRRLEEIPANSSNRLYHNNRDGTF